MAAALKEDGFVEARIARLESDVAHMRSDISKLENDMGEVKKGVSDLRVEVSNLRGEMNEKIGGLRADMTREIGSVNERIIDLHGETHAMGATLSGKIDKAIAETRLWILGGVLAVLMNVLSQRFHWLGL